MDYIRKNSGKKKEKSIGKTKSAVDNEKHNIEICIADLTFDVEVDEDTYGKNELKKLKKLIKNLSSEIYIDRTYVAFKGNRFKDAFIVEERWDELSKMIYDCILTKNKKCTKKTSTYISDALMTIAVIYMYQLMEKFDYDIDFIKITPSVSGCFNAYYSIDNRTSWNF